MKVTANRFLQILRNDFYESGLTINIQVVCKQLFLTILKEFGVLSVKLKISLEV